MCKKIWIMNFLIKTIFETCHLRHWYVQYSISYAITIATLIYLCTSRLCQDLSNADGDLPLESELWHFHTFEELDEEALRLRREADLKLDSEVYLHGL